MMFLLNVLGWILAIALISWMSYVEGLRVGADMANGVWRAKGHDDMCCKFVVTERTAQPE